MDSQEKVVRVLDTKRNAVYEPLYQYKRFYKAWIKVPQVFS